MNPYYAVLRTRLQAKAIWGRNEVLNILDEVLLEQSVLSGDTELRRIADVEDARYVESIPPSSWDDVPF
jgi:hypothetical protein